jgi:hypothetical protein
LGCDLGWSLAWSHIARETLAFFLNILEENKEFLKKPNCETLGDFAKRVFGSVHIVSETLEIFKNN